MTPELKTMAVCMILHKNHSSYEWCYKEAIITNDLYYLTDYVAFSIWFHSAHETGMCKLGREQCLLEKVVASIK